MLRQVGCALLVMLATSSAWAQAEPNPRKRVAEVEAERLLAQLQDVNLRASALERLAQLGPRARPALERATRHPNPDVRFNALYLLELEGVDLRRSLRVIVEGNGPDSGTYPEAKLAFRDLLGLDEEGLDPGTSGAQFRNEQRGMLVRYVLRQAPRGADHHVAVALDVLAGVIETDRNDLKQPAAEAIARLLDVDLGTGAWELPRVFGAFTWDVALPVLRARISGGSPEVVARAARTLGECTPGGAGPAALDALEPALKHRLATVRYAAVRALAKLNVDDELLLPWVSLALDKHPRVAAAMLRVGAERRLSVIREPAEQWAADTKTPLRLRLTAVICLGMLREGSPKLFERILDQDSGDLALAAVWALGSSGAPSAPSRILRMAQKPHWAHEPALYAALGHSGSEEALAALRRLEAVDPALAMLGYSRLDDVPRAVAEIMRFSKPSYRAYWRIAAEHLSTLYARRAIETSPEPIREAVAKLYNQTDPNSNRNNDRDEILEEVRRVGAPATGLQRKTLIADLSTRSRRGRNEQTAPQVLAYIAPEEARKVLGTILRGQGRRPQSASWYLRSLARAMAIAGDPSYISLFSLPMSERELDEASPSDRSNRMNNVGIDHLYARNLEAAALTFRQMLWCGAQDNIAAYNLACGASLSGDVDTGLFFLRRSVRNGYTNERHIRSDSDLNLLHGDPRFERIFRRLLLRSEVRLPFDPEFSAENDPQGGAPEFPALRPR